MASARGALSIDYDQENDFLDLVNGRHEEKKLAERLVRKLAEIEKKIKTYNPDFDFDEVEAALKWAKKNNKNIKKAYGVDDYFSEPLLMVENLVDLAHADRETILAAVLYSAVRPANNRERDVEKIKSINAKFGTRVASLVDRTLRCRALTLPHLHSGSTQSVDENRSLFRLMVLWTAEDPGPIMIRGLNLAVNMERVVKDRADRARAAREGKPAKPIVFSSSIVNDWQETAEEVLAPLANVAGLSALRAKLLNLHYQILQPMSYETTCRAIDAALQNGDEKIIKTITAHIETQLGWERGREFDVEFRPKEAFSAHEKALRKGVDVAQLDDLLGLRIILRPSVVDWMDGEDVKALDADAYANLKEDLGKQCLKVYGLLSRALGRGNRRKTGIRINPETHAKERFSPIAEELQAIAKSRNVKKDGRFKNYIAKPKGNFYEAVHDVLFVPIGRDKYEQAVLAKIECQIVDTERHAQNTYGAARHSAYKGDLAGFDDVIAQWRVEANAALAGKPRKGIVPTYVLNQSQEVIDISDDSTVGGFLAAAGKTLGKQIIGVEVSNGYDGAFLANQPEEFLPNGSSVSLILG